jgi:hypothetical protein
MDNSLEPLKVESALRSEKMKMEYRMRNKPKEINILDLTVIAALEKQVPGKPTQKFYSSGYDDDHDDGYNYDCPCCNNQVGQFSRESEEWLWQVQYCPDCGQRIKWD